MPVNFRNPIATGLAQLNDAATAQSFEIQFRNIQRSMVGQLNTKIQKVLDEHDLSGKQEALKKDYMDLAKGLPLISDFVNVNVDNLEKLSDIYNGLSAAVSSFSSDGDGHSVTEGEAKSIRRRALAVAEMLEKLNVVSHPDVVAPDVIPQLTAEIETLKTVRPVEGAIDDEDADPATNENRATLDYLMDLMDKAGTAISVTRNTTTIGNNMLVKIQAKLAANQADRIELVKVDQKEAEEEVEKLKNQYGQILQAISLTFEISKQGQSEMTKALLQGARPDPGSVVSLLT